MKDGASPLRRSAAEDLELPTPAAHAIISLGPDVRAELSANVPASHIGALITLLGQLTAAGLLGAAAPVMTVSAMAAAGSAAPWIALTVLIEVVTAIITVALMRRK